MCWLSKIRKTVKKNLVFMLMQTHKQGGDGLFLFMYLVKEDERVSPLAPDERVLSSRNPTAEGCPAEEAVSLSARFSLLV